MNKIQVGRLMNGQKISIATLLASTCVLGAGAIALHVGPDSSVAVDRARNQLGNIFSSIVSPEDISAANDIHAFSDTPSGTLTLPKFSEAEERVRSGTNGGVFAERQLDAKSAVEVAVDATSERPGLFSASLSEPASERTRASSESQSANEGIIRSEITAPQSGGESGESGNLLVLYGPVSDLQENSLNVLGHEFDSTIVWSAPVDPVNSVGRLAYVEAQLSDSGYDVSRIELFDDYSIPGATTVFVHGNIESADAAFGVANVGDLQVDVTGLAVSDRVAPSSQVAIPGIQPLPEGVILGYDSLIADDNLVAALATSTVLSISGSSLQSISGSSLQSISGSSLQSISGSSLQSISGSSLQSISGSSLQ